jgi:capsular polysaccharide export protein
LTVQPVDNRPIGSFHPLDTAFALSRDISSESSRHFLFVAAPFGPFSRRLGAALRAAGARCHRVILNAGDLMDWGGRHGVVYRGGLEGWPAWIGAYLRRERVTDLIVYGDSNPYCVAAMHSARCAGLKIHVLEQGYFRPNWITLERDGVNGSSSLPRDPDFFRQMARLLHDEPHVEMGRIAQPAVWRIFSYHFWAYVGSLAFPRFRFAYQDPPLRQGLGHVRRYLSQRLEQRRTAAVLKDLAASDAPTFLALLQRPGDSQLVKHSSVKSVAGFIRMVTTSFARHAPPEARLVFKCHPLDPGLEDHRGAIQRLAREFGLEGRVFYVDGGHLPSMVEKAAGVISVNSTAGLVGIEQNRPTIVVGAATYDLAGMTHQGGLKTFWRGPQPPDLALFQSYRRVVMAQTQINGAYSTARGIEVALRETVCRLMGD